MKLCKKDCIAICDFCKRYRFNGDANGVYTNNGFCTFHLIEKDPEDTCNDFHCFRIKD